MKKRLGQGKKKAGPAGISPRMFVDCVDIYRGYGNVDQILKGCENIGRELRKIIDSWTSRPQDKGKGKEVPVGTPRTPFNVTTPAAVDGGDGDDGDEDGAKGEKKKKNGYRHLIKGIPGA